jgi:hypothetical protein
MDHPRNEFRKFRECQLEKINDRLRSLWSRESRLSGPIDGMDIELMLRHLAERAGARDRNILYGITNLVVADFSPKQRKILFEWLNEIEESTPWGPRRRWRHFPPLQIGEAPKIKKTPSKGKWVYLYRAVDSTGATIDFLLSAKRDEAADERFLAKALGGENHPAPRVINTDKHAAYPPAIADLKADGVLDENSKHRSRAVSK